MLRKSSGKRKKSIAADPVGKNRSGGDSLITKAYTVLSTSGRAEKITLAIMFVMVALILGIGPFYQGLFFPRELLIAQIAVFGLLIAWGGFRIANKDGRLIETPLDICLIVLLLTYFVSFFFAVHKRDALEEVLKISAYLVVFLVALDISRHWRFSLKKSGPDDEKPETDQAVPPGLNLILHLLLVIATVITIASLGVAAGHWDFIGAYESNRIASPMGYANTAAAYLMAAYLLNLGLAPLAGKWSRVLYLAPASLMLITVVLTFSRGAWLMLPPLALLLVVAAAPGERLRSFLYLTVTALVAIPAALMVDPIFRSDLPARAWYLIIAAVILTVLLGLLVELYFNQGRRLRMVISAGGAAVVGIAFILTAVLPIIRPLTLARDAGEPEQLQGYQQVIGDVIQEETYQLSLEINAEEEIHDGIEQPEYAWGILVLGGLPDYSDEMLFHYQGEATDGWENKDFTFQTGEETTRLDIRLYNRYPGTSVTFRSAVLSSVDQDQKLHFALSRILPDRFYDRIFSYSRDRNMDRRLELFRDATKVIRDYPLLGAGGGAWAALYRGYQEQPYGSREVHNHFLQVWIEAGLFGFLAFAGIWVSFAVAFIRNCFKGRASPRRRQYWAAVFLPVAALGAHSSIDWNFSMAAVGFFLFALLGAGRSLDKYKWFSRSGSGGDREGRGLIIGIVASMAGIALLVYSVILLQGLDATWHSQELMEQRNLKQAATEMERAIRLDPFRAENYHNLGILIEEQAQRTKSQAQFNYAIYMAERAYAMEPFDARYAVRYGDLMLNHVDIDEGLAHIDRAIELQPFSAGSYIQPAWARLRLAEFFIENNNRPEAVRYLGEIMDYERIMQEQYGDTEPLAYIMGRANYLLGNHSDALSYYELVPEDDQFYEESQRRLAEIRGENDSNEDEAEN